MSQCKVCGREVRGHEYSETCESCGGTICEACSESGHGLCRSCEAAIVLELMDEADSNEEEYDL